MTKTVGLYGRQFLLSGSDGDDYFRGIVDGGDLTDVVLKATKPHVAVDAVCLDVGANIGIYSLALSALAPRGRVYAFEPSPDAFEWLARNLSDNEVGNVTSAQNAMGDSEGTIGFHDVPFFTAGSFTALEDSYLGTEALGSIYVKVPVTTIDAFVEREGLTSVDLIKIDVEGSEMAVLDGAARMLAEYRPTVVMEFNSFGFVHHQGVLPQAALARIHETFPHVFVIDRLDGSLARMKTPIECYQFLYVNGIHGPADNLVCSFSDIETDRNYSYQDAVRGPVGVDPLAAATELAAMKETLSWRVTSPLRGVRSRLDRVPALRRRLARSR